VSRRCPFQHPPRTRAVCCLALVGVRADGHKELRCVYCARATSAAAASSPPPASPRSRLISRTFMGGSSQRLHGRSATPTPRLSSAPSGAQMYFGSDDGQPEELNTDKDFDGRDSHDAEAAYCWRSGSSGCRTSAGQNPRRAAEAMSGARRSAFIDRPRIDRRTGDVSPQSSPDPEGARESRLGRSVSAGRSCHGNSDAPGWPGPPPPPPWSSPCSVRM
jgi:hypothetical protein